MLLLLSHFSRVRLCATPQTAVQQAPLSLGFSKQQQQGLLEVLHWFPSTYLYLTRKKKKQIKCRNYVVFLKCVHKLFHNPNLKVWKLILFPLSVDQNW